MGPLLLTALALFGATVAIGTVASRTAPPVSLSPLSPARRLAVILIAFASGCGVLGVVVGVLAIEFGVVGDPAAAWIVAGLAVGGGAIGQLQMLRNGGDLDPWVVARAVGSLGGLVVLGVVVAGLANILREDAGRTLAAWPFAVLGLVSAGGCVALGITGGRSLRAVAAAGDAGGVAAMARAIPRIVPFELVSYGASFVGIVLIVTSR